MALDLGTVVSRILVTTFQFQVWRVSRKMRLIQVNVKCLIKTIYAVNRILTNELYECDT